VLTFANNLRYFRGFGAHIIIILIILNRPHTNTPTSSIGTWALDNDQQNPLSHAVVRL